MYAKRIIPCLDVNNGRVVKGTSFVNLRDAGDPVEAAIAYNEQGADELVLLDITATAEGRDTIVNVVRDVANQVFIPFTVGGGIRTVEDFNIMLRAGADKVSVNSAAFRNPELISEAANRFGSRLAEFIGDAETWQEISDKYLESIAKELVRSGVLVGHRGKGGGYRLSRSPDRINVGDVLSIMEGSLAPVACLEAGAPPCSRAARCRTLKFWRGLDDAIKAYSHSYSIADLMWNGETGNDYVI